MLTIIERVYMFFLFFNYYCIEMIDHIIIKV